MIHGRDYHAFYTNTNFSFLRSYARPTRGRKRRAPTLTEDATPEECWAVTLRNLPQDFFTSGEAQMLKRTPFLPGEKGYGSVPLTSANNRDVYLYWKDHVQLEESQGRTPSTFVPCCRTWGQFARVCIVAKFVTADDLVREGYLFQCFSKREFLECFLHYYRLRGRPGTVSSKAIQLNKMCNAAYGYFLHKGQGEIAGKIKGNSAVSSQLIHVLTGPCSR